MLVRMKTTMAGPDGCASPGQIIDPSEEEARTLVAGGYAEAIDPPQKMAVVVQAEAAIAPPPERAARGKKK